MLPRMATRGTTAKAKPKTSKKKTSKKSSSRKAPSKKAASKAASTRKRAASKTASKSAKSRRKKKSEPTEEKPDLSPVRARGGRAQRVADRDRLTEIDETCNAWADIVAERMAADQTFADLVEQYQMQPPRDLRGLILWDALQAAGAHVSMITEVLGTHLEGRRGDSVEILADLRERQRRIAAVYAVNAFLAVLNQMNQNKPKWLSMEFIDPRFAVLALAHQTLGYAIEAAQITAPPDLTEQIIDATQDPAVWVWRRMPEAGTDTLAACAAAAAFFRSLDAEVMTSTDGVAQLYAEHNRATQED